MGGVVRVAVLAVVAAATLSTVGAAQPASRGAGPRLAFSQASPPCPPCKWQIRTAAQDGSGLTKLRLGPDDRDPRWSPNGKLIAYVDTIKGGYHQLHVMNANGSGDRRLLKNMLFDDRVLGWTSDSRSVIFAASLVPCGCSADPLYGIPKTKGWAIVAIDVRTGKGRKLVALPGTQNTTWFGAQESPNGQWIAVGRAAFAANGDSIGLIELVHPNGKGLHVLVRVPNGSVTALAWAPDSRHLAYEGPIQYGSATCEGDTTGGTALWLANAAGGAPRPLWTATTCGGDGWVAPDQLDEDLSQITWTPDGVYVVYPTKDYAVDKFQPNTWGYPLHELDVADGTIQPIPIKPATPCTNGGGSASGACTLTDPDWAPH